MATGVLFNLNFSLMKKVLFFISTILFLTGLSMQLKAKADNSQMPKEPVDLKLATAMPCVDDYFVTYAYKTICTAGGTRCIASECADDDNNR
jgi:hypothetical protein